MSDSVLTYCFDIDGTICTDTRGAYETAEPFLDRIAFINGLHSRGNIIKMFTARGSTTGIDWYATTERQLATWGLRYHELIMGKPFAHVFVDDRGISAEEFDWDAPHPRNG